MSGIDESVIRAQLELSEEHAARSGTPSFRPPAPEFDHVLVGHHEGFDQVAFRFESSRFDWKEKTSILDVSSLSLSGAPEGFGEAAYVLRYPSSERERLKRFVLELVEEADADDVVASTDEIIKRWSSLWGGVHGPMSPIQQRGLYGELLALEMFIQAKGVESVHCWEGPNDALHDFSFASRQVEVKVTGHYDPALEISSLNQLRPCHPELVLLMIQFNDGGDSTLPMLVDRIRRALDESPDESQTFERRLEKARYRDEHAPHYPTPYENLSFSCLTIDESTDVLHEDRLDSPVSSLLTAKWTLDPRELPFATVQDDFWAL